MGDINPEKELLVCRTCGTVAYRTDPMDAEKVKEYYRYAYRPAPTHANLITTTNKQNYVRLALESFFKKWKEVNDRPAVIGDIGCATGYLVSYFRKLGHKATGCELTLSFRRFAEHFYGIPVPEELEKKHKYDLLTMYHVLEHIPQPDVKLKEYVDMLADDGHFFISVPEWFDTLEEASGSPITDFTHLFHKDHINVFSKQSCQNLFAKAGLEIVDEDHTQYGQTYLLKKSDPVKTLVNFKNEDWQQRAKEIRTIKEAIDAFKRKDTKLAISLWPKFPEAHIQQILGENSKEPDLQRDMWVQVKEILEGNPRMTLSLGMWLYQQKEYDKALEVFNGLTQVRPNSDIYVFMGWCFDEMGDFKRAMQYFSKACELDPRKWAEMNNRICALAVKLPTWDEVATEEFQKKVMDKADFKPTLKDPAMA
jgi:SAM-dependent methyltransferase